MEDAPFYTWFYMPCSPAYSSAPWDPRRELSSPATSPQCTKTGLDASSGPLQPYTHALHAWSPFSQHFWHHSNDQLTHLSGWRHWELCHFLSWWIHLSTETLIESIRGEPTPWNWRINSQIPLSLSKLCSVRITLKGRIIFIYHAETSQFIHKISSPNCKTMRCQPWTPSHLFQGLLWTSGRLSFSPGPGSKSAPKKAGEQKAIAPQEQLQKQRWPGGQGKSRLISWEVTYFSAANWGH